MWGDWSGQGMGIGLNGRGVGPPTTPTHFRIICVYIYISDDAFRNRSVGAWNHPFPTHVMSSESGDKCFQTVSRLLLVHVLRRYRNVRMSPPVLFASGVQNIASHDIPVGHHRIIGEPERMSVVGGPPAAQHSIADNAKTMRLRRLVRPTPTPAPAPTPASAPAPAPGAGAGARRAGAGTRACTWHCGQPPARAAIGST